MHNHNARLGKVRGRRQGSRPVRPKPLDTTWYDPCAATTGTSSRWCLCGTSMLRAMLHAAIDRSKYHACRRRSARRRSWSRARKWTARRSPQWLPLPLSCRLRRTASRSGLRGRSRRSRLQSPRLIPHFRRRTPRPRPALRRGNCRRPTRRQRESWCPRRLPTPLCGNRNMSNAG